jgi:hypothetical protein
VTVKRIGARTAIVGALAFTVLGLGAGVANADQQLPSTPGMTWKLVNDDDEWEDWDDDWNRGWRGPRWDGWDGPRYGGCVWVPPAVSQWVPPAVC